MLITGLAVLLIVEVGGLIFVDRSYLKQSTADVKVVEVTSSAHETTTNLKIPLDNSATDIKASYDGSYLAFKLNGKLEVLDLTDGKTRQISMASSMKLGYYKWVYNRDQLIIAETYKSSYYYYAKLYNLNAGAISTSSTPREIRDTVNNTDAKIDMPYDSGYISGLDFSTDTVTTYLKISNSYGHSALWIFDVPYNNKQYPIDPIHIGNMQCLKTVTQLMYEDTANGKVCMVNQGALDIDGETRFKLLGFDRDDDVYLAKGDGTTTKEILYGSLVTYSTSGSTKINLEPTDMKTLKSSTEMKTSNILVTLNGNIYYNDSENKVFHDLKNSSKSISYRGEVVVVYDRGFITVNNGILSQNSFS